MTDNQISGLHPVPVGPGRPRIRPAKPLSDEPWARQEWESAAAYKLFRRWIALPRRDRPLAKAAPLLGVVEGTLNRRSTDNMWQQREAMAEMHADVERGRALFGSILEARVRHAEIGDNLLEVGTAEVADRQLRDTLKDAPLSAVVGLIQAGLKASRDARGMVEAGRTDRLEVTGSVEHVDAFDRRAVALRELILEVLTPWPDALAALAEAMSPTAPMLTSTPPPPVQRALHLEALEETE